MVSPKLPGSISKTSLSSRDTTAASPRLIPPPSRRPLPRYIHPMVRMLLPNLQKSHIPIHRDLPNLQLPPSSPSIPTVSASVIAHIPETNSVSLTYLNRLGSLIYERINQAVASPQLIPLHPRHARIQGRRQSWDSCLCSA